MSKRVSGGMDVFDAILARHSVRSYRADPVEEEKLKRVLEAARHAQSAQNRQPWRFIVVRDPAVKERVRQCYRRDWFLKSELPMIIVACAVPEEAWDKGKNRGRAKEQGRDYGEELFGDYWKVDVALAIQNLMLAATGEGLGTCFIGGFNEHSLKEVLNIPSNMRVVAVTPLGYANEEEHGETRRPRKSLDEIVVYDHFPTWA